MPDAIYTTHVTDISCTSNMICYPSGEAAKNHELIENLLGQTKEEQQQKLQERLRKRRERMSQGMTEDECDELEKKDQAEERNERNVIDDLDGAFEKVGKQFTECIYIIFSVRYLYI